VTWYHAGAVIDFDGPRYKQMSIILRDVRLADGIIVQIASVARIRTQARVVEQRVKSEI